MYFFPNEKVKQYQFLGIGIIPLMQVVQHINRTTYQLFCIQLQVVQKVGHKISCQCGEIFLNRKCQPIGGVMQCDHGMFQLVQNHRRTVRSKKKQRENQIYVFIFQIFENCFQLTDEARTSSIIHRMGGEEFFLRNNVEGRPCVQTTLTK